MKGKGPIERHGRGSSIGRMETETSAETMAKRGKERKREREVTGWQPLSPFPRKAFPKQKS